jgi:hypothetical protein
MPLITPERATSTTKCGGSPTLKTTFQPSCVFYAIGLSASITRGRRRVSARLIMRHTVIFETGLFAKTLS